MTKIVFVDPTGKEHPVEATPGQSLMQAATGALIPGIEASCGGNCICATCHCYVDATALAHLPAPDEIERSMLECLAEPRSNSRLTCQVPVTEAMDGVRVHVAASQH